MEAKVKVEARVEMGKVVVEMEPEAMVVEAAMNGKGKMLILMEITFLLVLPRYHYFHNVIIMMMIMISMMMNTFTTRSH